MCCLTKMSKCKIADHDIKAYKMVDMVKTDNGYIFRSPYRRKDACIYGEGKLVRSNKFVEDLSNGKNEKRYEAAFGIHTFEDWHEANHACCYSIPYVPRRTVLTCVIPKGTKYFESDGGEGHREYCSDTVRVIYGPNL